jgi:Protein of unknown function (DUF2795)
MDRASSKHSPRVDDEMAQETLGYTQGAVSGPRAEEWHEPEPPGEDQPRVMLVPESIEEEGDEDLSRLGRYIPRSALPGSRDDLVAGAVRLNAPDDVLGLLRQLDPQHQFGTVAEVWEALGFVLHPERR